MPSDPQLPNPNRSGVNPDDCAARAEVAHKHLGKLGRQQITLVLEAGELLLGAKTQLGHGKFEAALKRWKDEGMITFSLRSARRWMRLAKHAEVLKSAKMADLAEAEKYVKALEREDDENLPASRVKAANFATLDGAVAEIDSHIIKTLRKIRHDDGPQFLRKIVEITKSRLEALES